MIILTVRRYSFRCWPIRLALLILSPLFFSQGLSADTIKISGVAFQVDRFADVDGRNVSVTVLGKSRILPKNEAALYVLEEYLKDPAGRSSLSSEVMEKLLEASFGDRSYRVAAVAILICFNVRGPEASATYDLVQQLFERHSDSRGPVSKNVVLSPYFESFPESFKPLFLMYAGTEDLSWFRLHALAKAYSIAGPFKAFADNRIKDLIIAGNYGYALRIIELQESVFGGFGNDYARLKQTISLLQSADEKKDKVRLPDLLPLLAYRSKETAVQDLVDPLLQRALHTLADKQIKSGEYDDALNTLSNIIVEKRTPTSHQLALQALKGAGMKSVALSGKQVKPFLQTIARNDPAFAAEYTNILEEKVLFFVNQKKIPESRYLLNEILEIRPDPDAGNDRIRIMQAAGALEFGEKTLAGEFLDEIRTGISIGSRVKLFFAGLYGNPYLYALILLIPLTVKYALDVLYYGSARRTAQDGTQRYEQDNADPSHGQAGAANSRLFVRSRGGKQLDPLYEEYLECLAVFGLEPDADIKQIKMAYRNAVREIHPDLNKSGQSAEDSVKFVELTRAYDRLRELGKHIVPGSKGGGGADS